MKQVVRKKGDTITEVQGKRVTIRSIGKPNSATAPAVPKPIVSATKSEPAVKLSPISATKQVAAVSQAKELAPQEKPVTVKKTILKENPTTTSKSAGAHDGGLKVLFCISEAQPHAASGGLGEVGGSLPKAIKADSPDTDIRVVLPLYYVVPSDVRKKFKFLGSTEIEFAKRKEYCGVFEYKENQIIYYFIDNEKYFKRDSLYGYSDDAERFAFLSKACIDTLKITDFKPDIVHANDWHTGLAIVYLKTLYKDVKEYSKIKTLFTIHNINYQGKVPYSFMTDVLGLDYRYKNILEYNGQINFCKAAITCADWINTVSPTYAEELKSSEFAMGLENCIYENAHKLTGILNGVDYKFYNPKADKELFENYDRKSLEGKAANKRGIQKLFQMQVDASIPMIVYNGRLTGQKGVDLIKGVIDDILKERIQMIVMGNGESRYESFFDYIESKYQGKFKVLRYSNNLSKKLYAAADLVLMPSLFEPCGLSQMIASRYGTVPVVRETGGLKDSIRDFGCEGGGNGYTFKNYTMEDMLYSVRRGVQDFVNDGPAWENKVRICIERDFSWKGTVSEYLALYNKIKKLK